MKNHKKNKNGVKNGVKTMKNMDSILKKLMSVLCVLLMVSVVFSTVVKNVTADENDEEKTVASLNPDVAVNEYIHMVWQENITDENITQYEIMYVNNMSKNFENTLLSAISTVESLITKDNDYEDVLKKLNKALGEYNEKDFKHSMDNIHHAVKDLEKVDNTELIHALVDAVRDFAKTNILYAEYDLTFNNSYIQEAHNKYHLAVEKQENGNHDAAIKQFKNSYIKIMEAYEENDETYIGIDFGKIVRISYTGYDSVTPTIFLNGTIHVSWVEIISNETHIYYAKSTNNGITWWYFDVTEKGIAYLSYWGWGTDLPDLPRLDLLDIFSLRDLLRDTMKRFLEEIKTLDGCHLLYGPTEDGSYAPICDPCLDIYTYTTITVDGIIFNIIPWECIGGGGGGGGGGGTPPYPKAADLTVTDIHLLRDYPNETGIIFINITISNLGDVSVSGANASVYVDGKLLITIENINLLGIYPSNSSFSTTISWNAQHGYHNISVIADPSNGLGEGDEGNNELSRDIDVRWVFSDTYTDTYNNAIINNATAPDAVRNVTVSWNLVKSEPTTKTATAQTTTETTKTLMDTTKPTINSSSITPSDWKNGWSEVSATITDDTQVKRAWALITPNSFSGWTEVNIIKEITSKGYEMSLLSGDTWSAGYTDNGFSDGEYYVWVAASNGINSAKGNTIVKLDKTPPNNPTSCTVNGVTSGVWQNSITSPTFTWSGYSDDYSGISKFYYYFEKDPSGTSTN
ncbi:MAG: CARDB domain-containing protein, partial [Thermoplasmatales archaeon]|nr:CARDB domain-containing protein [Thermoplasmatales archaeon]